MNKLQSILGLGLTIIVVLAFVLMVVLNLPNKDKIDQTAKPIQNLPTDFLSDSSPLMRKIKGLNVPAGVPVDVNSGNVGRTNIFESF
jgi:hypothetical protein